MKRGRAAVLGAILLGACSGGSADDETIDAAEPKDARVDAVPPPPCDRIEVPGDHSNAGSVRFASRIRAQAGWHLFGISVAQRSDGDHYVVGTAVNNPFAAMVVIRTDADGCEKWRKWYPATGAGSAVALHVKVAPNGDAVMAVQFSGTTLVLDGFTLTNPMQFHGQGAIIRMNEYGDVLWATQTSSPDYSNIADIGLVGDDVIAVGTFESSVSIGTEQFTAAGGQGDRDIVLARLTANGSVLWADAIGGTAGDGIESLDVVADRIVLAGSTGSTMFDFDGPLDGPPGVILLVANVDGSAIWGKRIASPTPSSFVEAWSVALDTSLNVYLSGRHRQGDLGGGATPSMSISGYVAAYDPDGVYRWITELTPTFEKMLIIGAGDDEIYVRGWPEPSASLGPIALSPGGRLLASIDTATGSPRWHHVGRSAGVSLSYGPQLLLLESDTALDLDGAIFAMEPLASVFLVGLTP